MKVITPDKINTKLNFYHKYYAWKIKRKMIRKVNKLIAFQIAKGAPRLAYSSVEDAQPTTPHHLNLKKMAAYEEGVKAAEKQIGETYELITGDRNYACVKYYKLTGVKSLSK